MISLNNALLFLASAGGVYFIAQHFEKDKVTLETKINRRVGFVLPNGATTIGNIPISPKLSELKIPMVNASFYTTSNVPEVKAALNAIESQYGAIIQSVAALTNVPYRLILSVIFIESRGQINAVSSAGAVGLMQLIPSTATAVVALENIKKRLTLAEQNYLRLHLGARLDCIMKMKNMGTPVKCGSISGNNFISKADLFNPALNIMIGALFLGILMDEHNENNSFRLDKSIIRYNKGYFAHNRGKALTGSPTELLAKFSGETAAFIKKLVGINGVLSLLVNESGSRV